MRKYFLILVLILVFIFFSVFIIWQNPSNWFNNWSFSKKTETLERKIQALENKLQDSTVFEEVDTDENEDKKITSEEEEKETISIINDLVTTENIENQENIKVDLENKKSEIITTSTQLSDDDAQINKPVVDLFIMSYCPYGLQMQKAVLPVMELLKNKIDFKIRFVSYIMHDKIEIDENNIQYCLQKEQDDKLIDYLKCFTVSGDSKNCLKTAKVNETNLNNCISTTDKKFDTTALYNDKSTWLSGYYPLYKVDEDLNDLYKVQGSPTIVINGSQAQVSRSPEAVKLAICASFNNPPEECEQTLSTLSASPSFGAGTGNDTTVECGT